MKVIINTVRVLLKKPEQTMSPCGNYHWVNRMNGLDGCEMELDLSTWSSSDLAFKIEYNGMKLGIVPYWIHPVDAPTPEFKSHPCFKHMLNFYGPHQSEFAGLTGLEVLKLLGRPS